MIFNEWLMKEELCSSYCLECSRACCGFYSLLPFTAVILSESVFRPRSRFPLLLFLIIQSHSLVNGDHVHGSMHLTPISWRFFMTWTIIFLPCKLIARPFYIEIYIEEWTLRQKHQPKWIHHSAVTLKSEPVLPRITLDSHPITSHWMLWSEWPAQHFIWVSDVLFRSERSKLALDMKVIW